MWCDGEEGTNATIIESVGGIDDERIWLRD